MTNDVHVVVEIPRGSRNKYIKLLPQRDERNPVERLDSYLRATVA